MLRWLAAASRAFSIQVFTLLLISAMRFRMKSSAPFARPRPMREQSTSTEAFLCILQHKSNRRLCSRESPGGTTPNVAHSGSCGGAWSEAVEPRRGGTRGEISVPPRRGLPLARVGYSGLHGTGFTRSGKWHLGASGVKTPDESNALTSWLKPRPTNLPTFQPV